MTSAPYLALRVIKQLALDEGSHFSLDIPILCENFYIDDCLFGADEISIAKTIRDQVIQILKKGGFDLRKWASNVPSLISDLPTADHGIAFDDSITEIESLQLLGIFWCPRSDMFKFQVKISTFNQKTKRQILSTIAKFYDPLGWASPVIIVAKIFMQTLWKLQLDWDTELPSHLTENWHKFAIELPELKTINIPRWIGLNPEIISTKIHGFSDASLKAYTAVIYIRIITKDGSCSVSFISSKTRVAPLKQVSIPRLELCAAVLLAESLSSLIKSNEFKSTPIQLWTDSTIVLSWLQRPSHDWKTFVANRVGTIHSLFPDITWKHVSSNDNPADLASRGVSVEVLRDSSLWWHGPLWLIENQDCWPSNYLTPETNALDELKITSLSSNVIIQSSLEFCRRISSWTKLLRVLSYVYRWSTRKNSYQKKEITTAEINESTDSLIKLIQKEQFPDELKQLLNDVVVKSSSCIASLSPFLDADGFLRVGGRLSHTDLDFDCKHPIILRNNYIIKLLIKHLHEKCLHGGLSLTLQILRSRFWIINAKKMIRSVIFHCIVCIQMKATLHKQLMGSLPSQRVIKPAKPFSYCGVDYAGPMPVRITSGRGYKTHPAYICLFICMSTKTIHLEVVSSLTTEAFIATFRRFIARRGADAELSRVFEELIKDPRIASFCIHDHITWHFNAPSAPHFGGLWEAGVKSLKYNLIRVLAAHTPTFEELTTITSQIEACLNSRPLCPLNESSNDLSILTHGHFLVGGPLVSLSQNSLLETNSNLLSHWQLVQQITQRLWKLWSKDYVQSLQSRSKWINKSPDIQLGQMVLIKSDNLPPTKWNLGRVVELHPGSDAITRVVSVRTVNSTIKLPVVKLVLLPTHPL